MHILIVTHIFPPEQPPAGINANELAAALLQRGHQVTILTGWPSHPRGALYDGWKCGWRPLKLQREDGITLIRCRHSFLPRLSLPGKLYYYLTFAFSSLISGLFVRNVHVIVMQSTPLFGGVATVILSRIKQAKLFYWVHDVHPESAIHAGLLSDGKAAWFLKRLDTWICRRSDKVGTLTEKMASLLLARGVSQSKVLIQRHWLDESRIQPAPHINSWREKIGIEPNQFVVLHAGTMGYISGISFVSETVRMFTRKDNILFLFVGDGPLRSELEDRLGTAEFGLTKFLPFQSEEDLCLMQASGDVGLVTLLPRSGDSSIPSKMHGYAAAARPLIACVSPDSPTAQLIEKFEAGWTAPPGDADALASAIRQAMCDPDERSRRGMNARNLFEQEFGRRQQTACFCSKLESLSVQSKIIVL
jgi:colanic acid biosynthesis glycosyl transferase WcaI